MCFPKVCIVALLAAVPSTLAFLGYEGGVPVATYTKTNGNYIEVPMATVYDGDAAAVFLPSRHATLKNATIGKNQKEGLHCGGSCTLEFVWFEDVCEDAITRVRNVYVEGVTAYNGSGVVGINTNYGGIAIIKNVWTDAKVM
ncbi:pectate lyase [Colletotrichum orchidophilum]|uniref:Pectate lyase n=1 Tax=Colletotrichum orchidophilum TaxID=1209926 RepID=A0A1G4BB40_9PEZI|nr:pectate lyase [Colletotrichum orchidophilum]OHE98617.1 pectate lyase [Colletotrichum orchidophilum]